MTCSAASFRCTAALLLAVGAGLWAPTLSAQDAELTAEPAAAPVAPPAEVVKAPEAKPASPFPVAAANTGWALEFTHKAPHAIAFKDADGNSHWYWYMTFHVENREDETHLYIPLIQVITDGGSIYNGNAQVPQEVYNAVYKRCGNALSQPLLQTAGLMKPGKDFARDSFIIWPQGENDVDSFTIYVAGIYGETQPLNDPATGKPLMVQSKDPITGEVKKDAAGNPVMQQAELKRTLRLDYTCPGTLIGKEDAKLTASDDVMR